MGDNAEDGVRRTELSVLIVSDPDRLRKAAGDGVTQSPIGVDEGATRGLGKSQIEAIVERATEIKGLLVA